MRRKATKRDRTYYQSFNRSFGLVPLSERMANLWKWWFNDERIGTMRPSIDPGKYIQMSGRLNGLGYSGDVVDVVSREDRPDNFQSFVDCVYRVMSASTGTPIRIMIGDYAYFDYLFRHMNEEVEC